MRYDLEVMERNNPDKPLRAKLVEENYGVVAWITHAPYKVDLDTGEPRIADPYRGMFDIAWLNSEAKVRFANYSMAQYCPTIEEIRCHNERVDKARANGDENAPQYIPLDEEREKVLQKDNLICHLIDIEELRYFKEFAARGGGENNTLYRLQTDPELKMRIAPNPSNDEMQSALDMVFGEGVAVMLNDMLDDLPEDPEAGYDFIEPEM
ncbi:MAG: hypothetical protein RBR06_08620 [Desulfuromonadaceae bacterium]|nr:hypothetical protein [Desulfuromonadaceae bacterium]